MGGAVRFDHERRPLVAATSLDGRKTPKMRPPMRSSIACLRCRKSKIKCENTGGNSPCDSCIKTGKECIFKMPEANPAPPKRTEPPASARQERDGGSDRKKLKKIDDVTRADNQRATVYAEEALGASFLTEDLWESILDMYKLHFAPEMSFLHLPTLKEKLGRKFRHPQPENNSELNLVLLGVLTLTARFHPDLVKYLAHLTSNHPGNARSRPIQTQLDPTAASEYYADILTIALGSHRSAMKVASVERVQAWLMLGLYEWGQATPDQGALGAWMFIGTAIRMAHYLGLGFGDEPSPDRSPGAREGSHDSRVATNRSQLAEDNEAMDKEVKRRTMFSCFVLDRMLACGKDRVSVIQRDELQIQLPCSEDKFDLAMEVTTHRLTGQRLRNADDSVLSRFIQLVDIWGRISKYSSQGGRFGEQYPPWDARTRFYQLREELESFERDLPSTFTFSRSNYFKHENHQASSVYVLLHMLRCLCSIMLHREYIPFVPIRCTGGPEGPLDPPTFSKDQAPPNFWRQSAELIFKPAREIIDLIEICERKNKLPQSTIVLFAIWTSSFVSMVGHHFPWMDTERHTTSYGGEDVRQGSMKSDIFQHGAVALAFKTLGKMATWLKMASTYMIILKRMNAYFVNITSDYNKFKSAEGRHTLSVRRGGSGGGLEEYRQQAQELNDFGPPFHRQSGLADAEDRSRTGTLERSATNGSESSYATSMTPRATPTGSFRAINHQSSHTPMLPALSEATRSPQFQAPPSLSGSDQYSDSWRHQSYSTQPSPSGPYSHPSTPVGSMVSTAQAALFQGNIPYGQDQEHFFECLGADQNQPWSIMLGDLGLYSRCSTGINENLPPHTCNTNILMPGSPIYPSFTPSDADYPTY